MVSLYPMFLMEFINFRTFSVLFLCSLLVLTTDGCPSFCNCIGNYHGLKYVTCEGQRIIGLEGIPTKVEWLRMTNNSLSLLPNFIFKNLGLTSLIELDLDSNSIRSIGLKAFDGLRKLQAIDLRNNHMKTILPYTFEENEALTVLLLGQNPLGYLKEREPFLVSASLEVLDLTACRIGHLPPYTFGLLPSLQSLNLSYNQLVTVDEKVFAPLHNLEEVDFTGNPLICDSHIKKVTDWLKSKNIKVLGSPCDKDKTQKTPKMFEKLQVLTNELEDISLEKYVEQSREHFFQIHDVDLKMGFEDDFSLTTEKAHQTVEVKEVERKFCHRVNLPLIIILTTSGGFLLGGMFVLCLFYIKTNCNKRRRYDRRRYDQRSIDNSIPPIFLAEDQPPPPYSQVASADQSDNYFYDEDPFSYHDTPIRF